MPINLPRIEGTAYDSALNEFIDSLNNDTNPNQPVLAAHAVAAIGRFLMENHEVEVGAPWLQNAMALVGDIVIYDPMVDKLYKPLVESAKHPPKSGCAGAAMVLIAAPIVAGSAWWLLTR
jgi:hypothetical protein